MNDTLLKEDVEKESVIRIMTEMLYKKIEKENQLLLNNEGELFTNHTQTYKGTMEIKISEDPEVANIVNAINAIKGKSELINPYDIPLEYPARFVIVYDNGEMTRQIEIGKMYFHEALERGKKICEKANIKFLRIEKNKKQ